MILSQLVDAEEFKGLSPEELRDMILKLDEEVLFGDDQILIDPGERRGQS